MPHARTLTHTHTHTHAHNFTYDCYAVHCPTRPCGSSQARGNGHVSADLISWGRDTRWDAAPPSEDRRPRRAFVEEPSTEQMRATLHGVSLSDSTQEPQVYVSGAVTTPCRSGRAAVAGTPRGGDAPWALHDEPSTSAPVHLFDSISGAVRCGTTPARPPQPSASHALITGGEGGGAGGSSMDPNTPRASIAADAGRTAAVRREAALEVLNALDALHERLANRQTSWAAAFAPYDVQRSGVVGLSDLLRVFRSAGAAPSPSLLRQLPQAALCPAGVYYMDLAPPAAASAPPPPEPLLSATSDTSYAAHPASARRLEHAPHAAAAAVPATSHACASCASYQYPSGAPPPFAAHPADPGMPQSGQSGESGGGGDDTAARVGRLRRLLLERTAQLGRSPAHLWSALAGPSGGGALPTDQLAEGLQRLGVPLGGDDLSLLLQLLASRENAPQQAEGAAAPGLVSWECWRDFWGALLPDWADSAAERRRRLTLTRLRQALSQPSAGGGRGSSASLPLVGWLAARDRMRNGRVPLDIFLAGLKAHGILLSNDDAQLAAAELDPKGGGTSLAYAQLDSLLRTPPNACPMPS